MKAFQITEPGKTQIVDLDKPTPGAGEALLKIHTIGYCGTDLSTFRGLNPLVSYPRVPGHEIAATIESFGPGDTGNWNAGQQVLVIPYTSCGECASCRRGRVNACQNNQTLGVQREGAMAEYAVAPLEKLLASPKLSLQELALVEPLTVGFHAAARGRVEKGETVAVFGCGAIGLGAIAGAAFRGARVIAIDLDDEKLEIAKACGAAEAINGRSGDTNQTLRDMTDGHGPDVVIEAVGAPQTFQAAVDVVSFTGRVVYIGYAKAPVEYETKLFVMKEIDILGSRNALPEDFAQVVSMLEQGNFPVDKVVTSTVPLAAASDAMQKWSDNPGESIKIHIDMTSV